MSATIWGRVTRTSGGQLPYTATLENVPEAGRVVGEPNPVLNAGSFASAFEAQKAVEAAANRRLTWTPTPIRGDIESYTGSSPG